MNKSDYEALREQATQILRQHDMYCEEEEIVKQTDILKLAAKLNVRVITYRDLTNTQAKLHRKKLSAPAATILSQNTRIICYDDQLPRASTYVSHELAHFLLKHEHDYCNEELEADILAHFLLYPPPVEPPKQTLAHRKRKAFRTAAMIILLAGTLFFWFGQNKLAAVSHKTDLKASAATAAEIIHRYTTPCAEAYRINKT